MSHLSDPQDRIALHNSVITAEIPVVELHAMRIAGTLSTIAGHLGSSALLNVREEAEFVLIPSIGLASAIEAMLQTPEGQTGATQLIDDIIHGGWPQTAQQSLDDALKNARTAEDQETRTAGRLGMTALHGMACLLFSLNARRVSLPVSEGLSELYKALTDSKLRDSDGQIDELKLFELGSDLAALGAVKGPTDPSSRQ